MVLPVVLLRRYRVNSSAIQAAPPRRASAQAASAPPGRIRKLSPSTVERTVSTPLSTEQDPFNATLYGFKAFTIATTIVMSSAVASVAGVMGYFGIRDVTEFAAHMRILVSRSMPLLTEKIYRRSTSPDSAPDDPFFLVASTPQNLSLTSTTFDHDAAQQRLAEAFDMGGFDAWAEAVAKEMEAELEVERFRKTRTG